MQYNRKRKPCPQRKSRPPATLFGAVRSPSQVLMLRAVRLNELISKGGGFTERASGTIQILHTEPVMCPAPGEEADAAPIDALKVPINIIKIGDLLANKPGANPVIRPGDVVMVMEAEPVYVTGSVINPQGLFLRDKLMLTRAIAMVGGFRKEAKTSDVRIYRQKPGSSEQEIIKVDYAAIKKKQREDVLLQPYDVIEVQENGPFSGPRIFQTLMSSIVNVVPTTLTRGAARVIY